MRKLTLNEELKILWKLREKQSFVGAGSSRAVYKLNATTVVKIAIDKAGRTQNKREVEIFKDFGGQYLAKIYAYGTSIVLMEVIDPLYLDYYEELLSMVEGNLITENQFEHIDEILDFLADINGDTEDNLQLGYNRFGVPVSYDYGFDVDIEENVSNSLCDLVYKDDYLYPVNYIYSRLVRIKRFLVFSYKTS